MSTRDVRMLAAGVVLGLAMGTLGAFLLLEHVAGCEVMAFGSGSTSFVETTAARVREYDRWLCPVKFRRQNTRLRTGCSMWNGSATARKTRSSWFCASTQIHATSHKGRPEKRGGWPSDSRTSVRPTRRNSRKLKTAQASRRKTARILDTRSSCSVADGK